ncbi:MAG: flagellar protein FlaG [Pseudomonadota bacterium]
MTSIESVDIPLRPTSQSAADGPPGRGDAPQPAASPPDAGSEAPPPPPPSEAIQALRRVLGEESRLSIESDDTSGGFVYRSIDRETGEILRQWPPEKFLRFLEAELERANVLARDTGVIADEEV